MAIAQVYSELTLKRITRVDPAHNVAVRDRETGSEFTLRIPSDSPGMAEHRADSLGFDVRSTEQAPPLADIPEGVQVSRIDLAIENRDYGFMLGAADRWMDLLPLHEPDQLDAILPRLDYRTHPVNRHNRLQYAAEVAYKVGNPNGKSKAKAQSRTEPSEAWPMVERLGWQWLVEYPAFARFLTFTVVGNHEPFVASEDITILGRLSRFLSLEGHHRRSHEVAALARSIERAGQIGRSE